METKKSWPLILKILAFVACAGYVAGLILLNLYFNFQLLGLLIFTIIMGGSIFLFALAVCISSYDRPAFLRIPIIINGFITVPVILIAFGNGAIYVLKSRFSLYGTSQFFPMILSLIAQIFLVVVFHFCIDNPSEMNKKLLSVSIVSEALSLLSGGGLLVFSINDLFSFYTQGFYLLVLFSESVMMIVYSYICILLSAGRASLIKRQTSVTENLTDESDNF